MGQNSIKYPPVAPNVTPPFMSPAFILCQGLPGVYWLWGPFAYYNLEFELDVLIFGNFGGSTLTEDGVFVW